MNEIHTRVTANFIPYRIKNEQLPAIPDIALGRERERITERESVAWGFQILWATFTTRMKSKRWLAIIVL
jgi:hypothetical protein